MGSTKDIVFFFFREAERTRKKNTSLFFILPREVHRSFIRIFDEFLFFLIKVGRVFFPEFWCVFFFLEKFTSHSFIQIFGRKKKTQPGKKTAFSFIHSKILKNAQKRTFPCKKKIRYLWCQYLEVIINLK